MLAENHRHRTMSRVLTELWLLDRPQILEIGRTRSVYGEDSDGFSTIHFAKFLRHHERTGGRLVSIDLSRDTEIVSRSILNSHSSQAIDDHVTFLNGDALKVLQSGALAGSMFDLLYLDGLDCDKDEEASARWHLSCFELTHVMIKMGGWLLIDDVFDAKEPRGKGKLVVPVALENGFEIVMKDYQWLLRKYE